MQHFSAKNLGQIKDAQIELGDFTVLVGPQASGKSILLQMMKLCVDGPGIRHAMKNHGVSDKGDLNMFLELLSAVRAWENGADLLPLQAKHQKLYQT